MTEQVERLIERLNFGNACQAPEADGSRCGQCQCCQRAQAATTIERLSAEKAALEAKLALWSGLPTGFSAQLEALDSAYARARALEAQLAEARGALEEPTPAMIDAGVAFALQVSLGGDYQWSQYVRDLFKNMAKAALPAEQGEE